MSFDKKKYILDKIKEYDRIIIFRHFRPDGDAIGSTKGLREILRLTYPEKEVLLINKDYSDYLAFLGGEDEELSEDIYNGALGIVIDTATEARISNQNFKLCKEIIKIDHHIDVKPYGDFSWIEEERASASEMIADFYLTFKDELKINKEAATYIYTGIVTDSGRFRFRSVSGDTLRCAAALLDEGIDTDVLYANLYMKDFDTFKFQGYAYKKMKISNNGVAYLYVDKAMKKKFKLTNEEASAAVSYMDSIKGSLIWLAFIKGDNNEIRVRLRSRFIPINSIAEKFNGGGHACACGATVTSKKEMKELISDADALLETYKKEHSDCI